MALFERGKPPPSPAPMPEGELTGTFTGTFTGSFVPSSGPAPSPGPSPAPSPTPTPPSPSPAPGPSQEVELRMVNSKTFLQVGDPAYWIQDDTWGVQGMTRGTYSGPNGNQYESYIGRNAEPNAGGGVSWRVAGKFPKGSNEVKAYLTNIYGAKPGYHSDWVNPGGLDVELPDGSISNVAPSGETPGTFLPLKVDNLPPIHSSFKWKHMAPPTGLGQLVYDIWFQKVPDQIWGFNNAPLTHEFMIQLVNWGDYGGHPNGSNPAWYNHDVTLEGLVWHVYYVENFGNGWRFIVFKPDVDVNDRTLNLTAFFDHAASKGWVNGDEYLVDIECGIEAVEETCDMQIDNYKVWK